MVPKLNLKDSVISNLPLVIGSDKVKFNGPIGVKKSKAIPVGPLNFSLSEPITKGKSDITESFRFNLGTTF